MNNSIINASISMQGLQQKLDILANNMANADTVGYKKKEASFQNVLTNVLGEPEGFRQNGRMTPLGLPQGWGARLVGLQSNMKQGSLNQTDNPYDLAIEGDGLFEVTVPGSQEPVWTRDGSFKLSVYEKVDPATGARTKAMGLTTKDGYFVKDAANNEPIQIAINPADPTLQNTRVRIDELGRVYVRNQSDPADAGRMAGQIKLVKVVAPQLLTEADGNYFRIPPNIAQNTVLTPVNTTADGVAVKQGFIEKSNVSLQDEMTELIMVQRAFQLNSRAISSADTMMGLANNLRG
ncbi:flagellar hook-basal body protein [Paenibacillus lutrae]|uniref:Flagellar hook-basal body complex protein n=1 Tax=Paenibacillus lutrae TaxID=2078573 RepID=A0A7X3K0W4_9BACL|nr:flagellar hook-basal body protein [Paenibacillus lutrae]MVP01522.1 flagellar hook-basal body complex protein [Paenibacillus lutrae]